MFPDTWGADQGIGRTTLERLAEAWPRRAAVRGETAVGPAGIAYDPAVPDYPPHLVAFADHPRFLAASPEQQRAVLTGMWLGYNERVIATERLIAEPAFHLIMSGTFPGSAEALIRQAVQQSIVDESFHTYLHMMAISRTRSLRGVRERPAQPVLVTHRRLRQTLAGMAEQWERDVAILVWGAVAETCINALLALIARDRGVQPMHSLITMLHLRDETAHGSVVIEVMKRLYGKMDGHQRRTLVRCLPLALAAFAEQDPAVLRLELEHAGIPDAEEILADLRDLPASGKLVRDYSGVRRMVRELGIEDRVDFEFPEAPDWAPDRELVTVGDGR